MVAIRVCLCVYIAVGVPEENWTNHNVEYVALFRVKHHLLEYVWRSQLPQLFFKLIILRTYTPRENAGPGDTLKIKQVEHTKG